MPIDQQKFTNNTSLTRSKLARDLAGLSKEEWKKFEKWLASPWCNTIQNLVYLHKYLTPFYPIFKKDSKLKVGYIAQHLIENKKLSTRSIQNLMSEMLTAMDKFLVFERFSKNKVIQDQLRREGQYERGKFEAYYQNAKQRVADFENLPLKATADHLQYALLCKELYYAPDKKDIYNKKKSWLARYAEQLDLFYLHSRMRILHEFHTRKTVKGISHEQFIGQEAFIPLQENYHSPTAAIYLHRINRKASSLEDFRISKNLLLNGLDQYSIESQKVLLNAAVNDFARLTQLGNAKAYEDILELYKIGLEKELVLAQNKISKVAFNNIVFAAVQLNQFKYARQFIAAYGDRIGGQAGNEAIQWALAHVLLYEGKPRESYDMLMQINFKDGIYKIQCRMSILKCLFEFAKIAPQEAARVLAHCDSFRQYMTRDTIFEGDKRQAYLSFIKFTKSLCKFFDKKGQLKALQKIEKQIAEQQYLVGRIWLDQQIKKLTEQCARSA